MRSEDKTYTILSKIFDESKISDSKIVMYQFRGDNFIGSYSKNDEIKILHKLESDNMIQLYYPNEGAWATAKEMDITFSTKRLSAIGVLILPRLYHKYLFLKMKRHVTVFFKKNSVGRLFDFIESHKFVAIIILAILLIFIYGYKVVELGGIKLSPPN